MSSLISLMLVLAISAIVPMGISGSGEHVTAPQVLGCCAVSYTTVKSIDFFVE